MPLAPRATNRLLYSLSIFVYLLYFLIMFFLTQDITISLLEANQLYQPEVVINLSIKLSIQKAITVYSRGRNSDNATVVTQSGSQGQWNGLG